MALYASGKPTHTLLLMVFAHEQERVFVSIPPTPNASPSLFIFLIEFLFYFN
eukprot:m.243416 g.243416  ORF g.243416 m.243416 type:complete len:52 (-) comp43578_c0_seq1:28-183(-)